MVNWHRLEVPRIEWLLADSLGAERSNGAWWCIRQLVLCCGHCAELLNAQPPRGKHRLADELGHIVQHV
jgi:hypothetical protein